MAAAATPTTTAATSPRLERRNGVIKPAHRGKARYQPAYIDAVAGLAGHGIGVLPAANELIEVIVAVFADIFVERHDRSPVAYLLQGACNPARIRLLHG